MGFLFGDLTPAPFTTNFLEELRDAIDFAASIASVDQRIVTADATRETLRKRADEEAARLDALVASVLAAADGADKGESDSVVVTLAAEIAELVAARHEGANAALGAKLADDIRALEADTLAARTDYFALLQEYLLEHVPPAASETRRVELVASKKDERRYVATLAGDSKLGLAWSIELTAPEDGVWKAPLRVDRIADGLAISTPQVTGLIKKEVKRKKQKLDRHFVTTIVRDEEALRFELRSEVGDEEGFDLSLTADGETLTIAKTGNAEDATLGPFEVAAEDKDALLELASKIGTMVTELPKTRLVSASFDDLPFDGTNADAQPKLVELVSRLVAQLVPSVTEIAARSRSEDELVLRRNLADARREEIFMPKARLREKLATLDEPHQKLFGPFSMALDATPPSNAPRVEVAEPPTSIRSEVPLVRRRSGSMQAVAVPANAAAPEEGFREYAALFASPAFAASSAEEQRRALRLMLFGKTPPSPTEEMRAAHRAALPALQALVVGHRDPADYEMLGMAYIGADEPEKGSEMFKKALEIERSRDPASDLYGNLMRRVSQL